MEIEQAFYDFLNSNTTITGFFEDIEPMKRTDPLPMLAYTFISRPRHHGVEVAYPRIQFDVWADTYADKVEGRNIVFDELNFWRGHMSGFAVKSLTIMSELENHNSEMDIYRQIMDFKLVYEE